MNVLVQRGYDFFLRQNKFIIHAACLAFLILWAAGLFFFLLQPTYSRAQADYTYLQYRYAQNAVQSSQQKNQKQLIVTLNDLKRDLHNQLAEGPRSRIAHQILNQLIDYCTSLGLTVQGYRVGDCKKSSWCEKQEFCLEVTGAFDPLVQLADQLVRMKPQLFCKKFSIARVDQNTMRASINAKLYCGCALKTKDPSTEELKG